MARLDPPGPPGPLGDFDEETSFVEFDVGCNVDLVLGYNWLRVHDLALMGRVTAEVQALLQARQDQCKVDARGRNGQFAVRDEELLDTEHMQLPSRWLLSPR